MATGKYLSLEEARNDDKLERFAKEHQSAGDKHQFTDLLDAMASPAKKNPEKKSRGEV